MSDIPPLEEEEQAVASVRDALRALGRERPSDDSRRATLRALGLTSESPGAPVPSAEPEPSRWLTLLRWVGLGLLVGLALVAWQFWFAR